MAALAMTPKLLNRISNEKYQEKDKWKIDDIALGPANELLISGHNLEIPQTFISVYEEASGNYDNFPEFNRSFDQTQPGEQLVLISEGSLIIGLKVESEMQFLSIDDMVVSKNLTWKRSTMCMPICFYRGKLYSASSSSTIVSVCNLDSEEKSDIFLSDMKSDCVLEIVVVMEKIYVCTKVAGQALVFSMTGSKKMEFKNAIQTDAMAKSICIHERTEVVFVSWNNFQIQLYSQKTSRCLRSFDMTEKLHKIRVTTEHILVTLNASKCTVTVYDVGEAIKFGESQNTILSSVKKKDQKKLMSHDVEILESHPAGFETFFSPWKSASKQSKVEKPRDMKELYMKQLEENENIRRQYDRDVQKLSEKTKELEGKIKELESQQEKSKDNLEEEKEKVAREERSRVQAETSRKSLEKTKAMLEKKKEDLKKQLAVEQGKVKVMKETLSQAETSRKSLEKTKAMLEKEKKDLNKQLAAEQRKCKDMKESLSQNFITSLHQVRSVIGENLDNIIEHSLKVNQLGSVQMKQNNENLERRRRNRYTRERRSALSPKLALANMHTRHSRGNKSTPVGKLQQDNVGYTTDSTTDNEGTSGYETVCDSAAKIHHGELDFTTDSATDYEDARSNVSGDTSETDTVKGDSDQEESLDGQSKLEVCARVSVEGANLQIAETEVSLFIPPGALSEEQTIHMKIIPQPCDAKAALKFECNSVVVVELLPNNCRFQCPVSLTLPHCLQLKEEYERNSVDVLISHHDEGSKPKWEILHDTKFYLWKENCTISLHSFCWVTYEIHDTIVEAKRIKLYTAGKKMRLKDRITEVEVGFYPDLPGSGKILELNKDMHLSQRKPYVFLKTGEKPLLINLHKVVPKEWNNSQPDENPKIIPFESVSISEERSCPFVLERSGDDTEIPLCIFKVGQKGRNEVELTIRPDVLTA